MSVLFGWFFFFLFFFHSRENEKYWNIVIEKYLIQKLFEYYFYDFNVTIQKGNKIHIRILKVWNFKFTYGYK